MHIGRAAAVATPARRLEAHPPPSTGALALAGSARLTRREPGSADKPMVKRPARRSPRVCSKTCPHLTAIAGRSHCTSPTACAPRSPRAIRLAVVHAARTPHRASASALASQTRFNFGMRLQHVALAHRADHAAAREALEAARRARAGARDAARTRCAIRHPPPPPPGAADLLLLVASRRASCRRGCLGLGRVERLALAISQQHKLMPQLLRVHLLVM